MKIVVIHGSPRKGNTYKAAHKLMTAMRSLGPVEFIEFSLPNDMPEFCRGCFVCFTYGEDRCPHASYVQPIVKAMDEADGIVLASPVYVMQLSGGMKAFLDHLAYVYINHRPRFMYKKAVVMATTAGAGIGNCLSYLAENLSLWGVNKIYKVGIQMASIDWDGMKIKQREKAEAAIERTAATFYSDIASGKLHSPSLIQVAMFSVSQLLAESHADGVADKEHWRQRGWMEPGCSYLIPDVNLGLKKPMGRLIKFVARKVFS